jgi:hypothetical protein
MSPKLLLSLLIAIAFLLPAAAADAAIVNERKIKRWSDEDKQLVRALDVWMSDEEMKIFVKLKTSQERGNFLKETGYFKRWEDLAEKRDTTAFEAIKRGEVVNGMSKDEVFMAWDKPMKIRDEFKREAYVKVLWYEFEIDRKGREFLVRPDSETAYKNEIITRHVYLYNDSVHAVVEAGTEEATDIVTQIIEAEKKKEAARKAEIERQTNAGAAAVKADEDARAAEETETKDK